MQPSLPTTHEALETAVENRRILRARRLIDKLLISEDHSLEARITASRYFRRIGDPLAALRVLGSERSLDEFIGSRELAVGAKIELSSLLAHSGASTLSIRLLDSLSPRELASGEEGVPEILNFSDLFEKSASLVRCPGTVRGLSLPRRLRLPVLAEAWFETGKRAEAISLIRDLVAVTPERALRATLQRTLGAFLVREGRLFEAETALEAAETLHGELGFPSERGTLDLWQGALLIENGWLSRAGERLTRAWKRLYRPGLRPEPWLEVLYFRGLLRYRECGGFPKEWSRLLCFPSPARRRLVAWIEEKAPLPGRVILDTRGARLKPSGRGLRLEMDTQGIFRWGENDSDRLCALLVAAGSFGLPLLRAFELIWPGEPFSLDPALGRIDQTVRICQAGQGLPVRRAPLHLRMGPGSGLCCLWDRRI